MKEEETYRPCYESWMQALRDDGKMQRSHSWWIKGAKTKHSLTVSITLFKLHFYPYCLPSFDRYY